MDHFNIGDQIKCKLNLGGREWTNPKGETVYFNSDVAWFIEKYNPGDLGEGREEAENTATDPEWMNEEVNKNNDLPF